MTARTANEQRIEALEAKVVTMRGALEGMLQDAIILGDSYLDTFREYKDTDTLQGWPTGEWRKLAATAKSARSALADSADYANKCVVNREEWDQLWIIADDCQFHLNKLDSLRKVGGK